MRILFVCHDNACASQVAEGLASLSAPDGVEAWSASPMPATRVDERALAYLAGLGVETRLLHCKALEELPDIEFDYLVTLGGPVECPITKAKLEIDWDIPDPATMNGQDFRDTCKLIGQCVEKLLSAPRMGLD